MCSLGSCPSIQACTDTSLQDSLSWASLYHNTKGLDQTHSLVMFCHKVLLVLSYDTGGGNLCVPTGLYTFACTLSWTISAKLDAPELYAVPQDCIGKLNCPVSYPDYGCHYAVQEKNGVIEQLEKQKQKKGEQVQQAHADLARQAALIKDLQGHTRGKKEAKQPGVPADQVWTPLPHPYPFPYCTLHPLRPTPTSKHYPLAPLPTCYPKPYALPGPYPAPHPPPLTTIYKQLGSHSDLHHCSFSIMILGHTSAYS